MSERNMEAQALARKVVEGGIVAKATERLVYQIVEVCAEHEQEAVLAEREACAELARTAPWIAAAIRARKVL